MITEREFRNSSHRDALKALLDNDATLKLALQILGETTRPRGVVEPRPNAHLDTLVAQKHYRLCGRQETLDHLMRLSEPMGDEAKPDDEDAAFFHALPDQMKEAIRKTRQQTQL